MTEEPNTMRLNSIEDYKKGLKLTKLQRSILVGKLLGDGHLETQNKGRTYRLKIKHSLKQKEYVDWIYEKLKEWVGTPPKVFEKISRFPNGKEIIAKAYGFSTYSHGTFRFYAQQFYEGKRKKMPKLIEKLLTPEAIGVWYLDDGSFKSDRHRTFIIHTHGFIKSDLRKIQEALFRRFGIKTNLHIQRRKEGTYWRIYVFSESAQDFSNLIAPVVREIPSLKYKLGNKLPKE